MLWALIATAIMAFSGEGDDTVYVQAFSKSMTQAINEVIQDPTRKAEALDVLGQFEASYVEHRKQLEESTKCIKALDQSFEVTEVFSVALYMPASSFSLL